MDTQITNQSIELAARLNGLRVVDRSTADQAAQRILLGKDMIKEIKALFTKMKRAVDESKQKILAEERIELAKIEPAVERLSQELKNWDLEQERKRREAEEAARRVENERRRLEAEALRKADEARQEEERKRLQLEREAERLRQEEIAKANDAVAQKRIAEERERLRLQAEANRKAAEEAEAAAISEAAEQEVALGPVAQVQKEEKLVGRSYRDHWVWVEGDLSKLPREYLVPNEELLNKMAGVLKDKFNIPGGTAENRPVQLRTK
jgi:hypothetical protein